MSNNLRTRNGMPFNFVNGLKVRGMDIESLIPGIEGIPEAGSKYQFAGDGTNKSFTLPVSPYNKDAVDVYVKQLYVHPDDYTLVGDTITLVEAPPAVMAGETYNVVIKVSLTTLNGYVNANRVSFEGENLDDILEKGKPLANYSNLRAYTGAATQVRITDPGIAGFFYYDAADTTSADNGGTIIVASNGKRWKRIYDGTINVFWFMTPAESQDVKTGSLAIDVTAAVQNAINVIIKNGEPLFLPAGLYKVTAGLTISGLDSSKVLHIFGAGKNVTRIIFTPSSGSPTCLSVDLKYTNKTNSLLLEHIGFSKSGAGAGSHCIKQINGARSLYSNLYIYGFSLGAGIVFDIENNLSGDFNKIEDSYIGACNTGIWFDNSATVGSYIDANFISGCQLISNTYADIRMSNTGGIAGMANAHFVSDTWIQGASTSLGISIENDVTACKFNNISIDGTLDTTAYVNIAATCGYNFFNNITIDGEINDLSKLAEFINLRRSSTINRDQRSIISGVGFNPLLADPVNKLNGMLWYRSDLKNFKAFDGVSTVIIPRALAFSKTFDPISLAPGAGETTTISASGVDLGDFAVASFDSDVSSVTVTAYIRQANQLAVRFHNGTGSTLDLPSGTLRVLVIKK